MTESRALAATILAIAAAACATPPPERPAALAAAATAPPSAPAAPDRAVPLPHYPALRASSRLPGRATYDPMTLGVTATQLAVRLTNDGAEPIATERLRFVVTASRDGAAIACKMRDRASSARREPAALDAHQTFTFTRELNCAFALPRAYDVRVGVAVGDGPVDEVASGSVPVVATSARVPLAIAGHPGLFGIVSGESPTRPVRAGAEHGDYAVVVGLVNGGDGVIRLGAAHVSFDVYRKGTDVHVAGEAKSLAIPDALGPAETFVARVVLTSAPTTEGEYFVVGKLAIDGAAQPSELGRFDLQVTSDPMLYAPLPERSGPGGPPYDDPKSRR
jgi:hypothetical protein